MKNCPNPKCSNQHNNPGKFCSRSCANSRTFSKETNQKKSIANKQHYQSLTLDQQKERVALLQKYCSFTYEDHLHKLMTQDWDTWGKPSKRIRVILEQHGKCNKCELSEWLGQPIMLELEHKNGNRSDDSRDNVEALCPNCHAQTPTWRGRKKGQNGHKTQKYLDLYLGRS